MLNILTASRPVRPSTLSDLISDKVPRPAGTAPEQTHRLPVADGPVCLLVHVPVAELADMLGLRGQLSAGHSGLGRPPVPTQPCGKPVCPWAPVP